MSKDPNHHNLHLSGTDVDAILCSLPLLDYIEADTPAQQAQNSKDIESATNKLLTLNAHTRLDANEMRVIAAALTLALGLLYDNFPELKPFVDADHLNKIQRYFFVINRLEPLFNDAIAPLL